MYEGNSFGVFDDTAKPNLFIVTVCFKTRTKLLAKSQSMFSKIVHNFGEETHILQFELETVTNPVHLEKILLSPKVAEGNFKEAGDLIRKIIGVSQNSSHKWVIGDVD